MDYIAFFFAIKHDQFEYLETTLKEYDIGLYLIGAETAQGVHLDTEGQHFHFVVQMTEDHYHAFSTRLKKKFKLIGRCNNGKPKQYGKVTKIEDIDRMCAYTIKDGNIRTNMTEAQLDRYKEITFKKKDETKFQDELFEYLDSQSIGYLCQDGGVIPQYDNFRSIAIPIITYYQKNDIKGYLSKIKIESYVRQYQMRKKLNPEEYYNSMYPHGH